MHTNNYSLPFSIPHKYAIFWLRMSLFTLEYHSPRELWLTKFDRLELNLTHFI